MQINYRPAGRVGGLSSNFGPVKSNTVLQTVRHRCDIFLTGAVLPGRNDLGLDPIKVVTGFDVIQRL